MDKKWTEEQLKAINDTNKNILVSAAAGSGKTAVLVERIVNKITKEDGIDIDKLVVVTYTKAAAAEMKARIRNRLDDMLDKNESDVNLVRQIALVNNAQITTIDSFCLWIIKNHFSEINLDPGFHTADNGEITLLENDVMKDMLEEYYKKGEEDFINFVDAYGTGRSDANIEEIIKKLYGLARSNPWPQEWYEQALKTYTDPQNNDNKAIEDLYTGIKNALSDYKRKYEYMLKLCERFDGPIAYMPAIQSDYMNINRLIEAKDFKAMSESILKVSFDRLSSKKMPDVREDLKLYVKGQRDKFKKYITGLLNNVFTADIDSLMRDVTKNASAINMMITLAKDFADRMAREKKDRGIIDFNDMEHFALDILVKNENGVKSYTKTADELAEYYDEILIDEYQDSNQLQEEILMAVSKNRMSDSFNNVYMVGDVKQSIYKFRLACPELFMKKYYEYDEEEDISNSGYNDNKKIELQKNFRSRENILNTTNDVFYRVMNKNYCGIKYDEKQQLNVGLDYPLCDDKRNFGQESEKNTEVVIIDTAEDEENSNIEAEAKYTAERIKELMSKENPYYVYDADEDAYRKLEYSDIAVLTRTLTGWADTFVNILLDNGIPAMADTAREYFKVREIKVLISMLTCIDNPLQDIPMAAVLLSYFGGFSEDDLAALRIYGNKGNHNLFINQMKQLVKNVQEQSENCDEETQSGNLMTERELQLAAKCREFLDNLNALRNKSRLMTIYDLLWDIVYNTGYYDYVGTMPAGKKRQDNIDVLLDRASSFEGTSYSGLFNFLRYIERLQKYNIDIAENSGTGDSGNAVRVMSIHKSKGLEFPVVIVAGLNKKINKTDARNRLVTDQQLGIGTDYVNLDKKIKTPTIIKGAVARKILRDSISEEQRVLYVAMTRAREKLIMIGSMSGVDKNMSKWQTMAQELCMDGMFSYAECENIDKFSDMVVPVALMDKEYNKGSFEVVIINSKEKTEEDIEEDTEQTHNKKEENVNPEVDRNKPAIEELPPYVKDPDANKKVKITVSELKQMQHEADFDNNAFMPEQIKEGYKKADTDSEEDVSTTFSPTIPKFISKEEEVLSGNERGTAYHRVMECLDYNNDGSLENVKLDIKGMVDAEKLSEQQAESVNPKDIYTFVNSDIGKRIKQAVLNDKARREQPFMFEYDNQLVQGVIDIFIIEDNKVTIIDYKTDRVKSGIAGEKELKKRYAIQLDYYAKAISQITGLEIKEKIIYSFALGKQIEV